jgi:hypothetical protein
MNFGGHIKTIALAYFSLLNQREVKTELVRLPDIGLLTLLYNLILFHFKSG